ncbi:FAD-dependent monooxygenase [Brevundimonas intermedia]|nr:FAD-dependent monooxygenase [Brevundimonas intermedia]
MAVSSIIDVLIIGGGPTGSTLAIDLKRRGLTVRIVDKAAGSFEGSRAKGVQARTQEVLQDLGALEDVQNGGGPYPLLGLHLGPLTIPWRMMAHSAPTADVPFPNILLIPQFRTDKALHDRLESLGGRVEYLTALERLEQDETGVTATLSREGVLETVRARYLVGADGGGSSVRIGLGIAFAGSTHEEDRMIIVDATTTGLSHNRWHVWPGGGGKFIGACPLPNSELFQWMIRLPEGETPELELEAVNRRIQKRIKDRRVKLHDIQWKSVFRPNIRLAERYGKGRVFLAGDAAHVHPPAGAQGLNTGVQDAYNLGWKLGQVLAGADPQLIDSYEAERRPIAAAVLALATRKFDGIAKSDPASIKRGKDESQLAVTYREAQPPAPGADQTRTLQVGDRAPDAELVGPDGKIRLFDQFVGPQFTAIAWGPSAVSALVRLDWPSRGAGLKRIAIDTRVGAGFDMHLADPGRTFFKAYGVTGDTLFLIRPDGYVAQIACRDIDAKMKSAVARFGPPTGSAAA